MTGVRMWGLVMTMLAVGVGCATSPVMASATGQAPIRDVMTRSDAYFITQYYHKKWNPTQKRQNNANCGPTSLAMALRAFGRVPRAVDQSDPATLIRHVRKVMTGSVDEGAWTYPVQVADGARRFGLHAKPIYGFHRIKAEMAVPGRMVVVNLNPTPAYADKLVYPYDGGHFALLTAIEGDKAYLSDPLGKEPIVITLAQLEKALTTPLGNDPDGRFVPPYNGGVLLWE